MKGNDLNLQAAQLKDTEVAIPLDWGAQTPVLEGHCPAGFRCFPASTHLTQIKFISSKDC